MSINIKEKTVVKTLDFMDSADLRLCHVLATDLLCGPEKIIANKVLASLNPLKLPLTDLNSYTQNLDFSSRHVFIGKNSQPVRQFYSRHI